MKKIIYSAFATCMLLFASCDKDYLETIPTDQILAESVFTTTDNAWAAINGMHRAMFFQYSSQDQAGQGSVMIGLDMLGEDVVNTSTGNNWWITTYRWLGHTNVDNGSVRFVYRFYYKLIANANMIIANIDNASGPQEDKDAIKGQALAYRAWAHHQLVQIFAERYEAGGDNSQLGVPIMTVNTIEGQPRATVEEVYMQINADINAAIAILPVSRNAKSHINLYVAQAMKARVALTMGNWIEVAALAREAINGAEANGLRLATAAELMTGFNDVSNPGWMWGSDQVQDQQSFFFSFFAYMSANFNSTNIRNNPKAVNKNLYAEILEGDIRKQWWDPEPTSIRNAAGDITARDVNGFEIPRNYTIRPYMNRKFISAGGTGSSIGDVPYMRLAEMYLIEAEALARTGRDSEAQIVLNELLKTRFVEVRDDEATKEDESLVFEPVMKTGQELIDEILLQRRIELWGEGFRFLDLKRTNSALNRTGANHVSTVVGDVLQVPAGDNRWQWAIPRDEINANPMIEQNPY